MKKIKLIEFKHENETYYVYLGNGTRHKFSSQKQVDRFLSATSKYLTTKFYELRDLYRAILDKYEDCWPYMDANPVKGRNLREELLSCEKSFDLAVNRCSITEGNAWTFIHLHKASCNLKNILLALDKEYLKRSIAHHRYQLDNLLFRLQTIESDLNTYGQRTADVITLPQHLTSQMQVAG